MDSLLPQRRTHRTRWITFSALIIVSALAFTFFGVQSPTNFPSNTLFHIEKNTSLSAIARNLKTEHLVRSETLLKVFVVLFDRHHRVVSGDYYFKDPQSVVTIASRLIKGNFGMIPTKVTFPEGSNIYDIDNILIQKIPDFDAPLFLKLAADKEGYLFPDTYFFFQNVTPERVIEMMTANFNDQIKGLAGDIKKSGNSLADIVTMASILEEEANTAESRRLVSGILWKRIDAGIPLQVDSTFIYINGKKSSELTTKDLSIDSPYNTYKYPGLPKGPIANPGLDALVAAISPTKTDYLYFLSDSKGNIYYAKTLAEHNKNKAKYLNR